MYLDIKICRLKRSSMIHHVLLACPAEAESSSREFYTGVLGLAEIDKPPALAGRGGCWFRGYGIELHLGVEADFRPARKAHPALAGYPVSFDDEFPGMRRFYSSDPHGNRLEFLEPLEEAPR
jgi:catechol 2,3-dioxygenase-like lactoylglutathione lyase family enzyme